MEPSRLIFAHNGKRLFSISDPNQEEIDSINGKLGDVNAITSIANSNKTTASIGKFGVGFKAVFQYTSTPFIYSPNFCFKIERFIVPKLLKNDFPSRASEETLFVFPFDHPDKPCAKAYSEIADKLRNLCYPLLFLSELKHIEFELEDEIGFYHKKIKREYSFNKTKAQLVLLTKSFTHDKKDQLVEEELWLFSQADEANREYCVGIFIDQRGKLRPVCLPAFCFFPTKEVTGLNFIVHAPFLLNDSREGILAGEPYNLKMVKNLSSLAAQAFRYLKIIGQRESKRLIDDTILQLIPYNKKAFSSLEDYSRISFLPFYETIQNLFRTDPILPTVDGYVAARDAFWGATSNLPKLFSNTQLQELANSSTASWILISKSRDAIKEGNSILTKYIDQLGVTSLTDLDLITGWPYRYNRAEGKGITASFIEGQSLDWLIQFYQWINASSNRRNAILNKPIFINQDRKAVAAFKEDNKPNLFFPREREENIESYNLVHQSLIENGEASKLLKAIEIKVPSQKDYIHSIIFPLYKGKYVPIQDTHFQIIFNYYCESSKKEANDLLRNLKSLSIFEFEKSSLSKTSLGERGNELYFPTPDLKKFFKPTLDIKFLAFEKYLHLVGKKREPFLKAFLKISG